MGFRIKYPIYPNDPDATWEERSKTYGASIAGLFLTFGTIAAVYLMISETLALYKEGAFAGFSLAAGFAVFMSIVDFFYFFSSWHYKKELAKKYFLLFFGGLLFTIGFLGMIMGVYFLCHGKTGAGLLAVSFLGTAAVVIFTLFLHARLTGKMKKVRLFTEKEQALAAVFCPRCGHKTLDDSLFCSSCGKKLKERI